MILQYIALALVATVFGANLDKDAYVLRLDNVVNPDGSYSYAYGTSNGINADESGVGGENARGEFGYVSPEGEAIQLSYVADENGFQPSGSHLPTPPPIPDAIIKALRYIAENPPAPERK